MAREYLRWTPETTWGTYDAVATPAIIQLDQNNAFTMRKKPVEWMIRSAGAYARRVQKGSSKYALGGGLNMLCYDTQMAVLAPALFATSGNVLKSATVDHVVVMEDSGATKVYQRYLGVMAQQVVFSAKESDQLARLNLTLIGKSTATITVTDLAEPAAGDYPSGAPYVFEHCGAFTLATSRTEFEEFTLTIKNNLDARFMRTATLSRLKYCGRDVDFAIRFPYLTTADRAAMEAQTALAASMTMTNGSNSMAFQFNSKNFVANVSDALDLDKVYLQSIEGQCFFDASAGTPNDLAVTVV
jgi:Phage tail tube protein